MSLLHGVGAWLLSLLRVLAYEWVGALLSLLRRLCRLVRRWLRRRQLPERERKVSDEDCVTVPRGLVDRPDPLLYSQTALLNAGLAVTWDNPDIQLYRAGAPVSSWELEPATTYDVVARVWNGSPQAPVVGLPVRFSMLSFGIGAAQTPIGLTSIPVLGVKGGPDHPAFARIRWTTPATAGHYCLQVQLEPADDRDPGNNLGAENTLVGEAHSPAELVFELRNDTRRRQTYRLEVDTYTVPHVPPCQERRPEPALDERRRRERPLLPEGREHAVPAAHDRRHHPVPPGWSVDLAPRAPSLDAGESVAVRATVTPPDGFVGRQAFNVNGFHDGGLAGGVTLYVDAS